MAAVANLAPDDDLIEHEPGLDCACGPAVQFLGSDIGLIEVIVHWSLDGREAES